MGINKRDSGDDDASAEMHETLLKTGWSSGNGANKRSCFFKAMDTWRSVVNSVLLVTILMLLLVRQDASRPEKTAIGGDLSGFAPKCESSF